MSEISVLRTKFAYSWPMHPMGEAPEVLDVADAMTREFSTDAHFTAYALPEGAPRRRLCGEALAHLPQPPSMVLLVADVDAPEHVATAEWRAQTVERLAHAPGKPFGPWSRGGLRLVWRHTPRPVTDPAEWAKHYLLALVALAACTGIVADPTCSDWTRLYRVPHATRDGVPQRHGWACGDPYAIGQWEQPDMSPGELAAALAWLRLHGGQAWRSASMHFVQRPERPRQAIAADETAKALTYAVRAVEAAGKGRRNAELFGRTRWLAALVDRGELDAAAVARTMLDAALRVGLAEREARRTIASALGRVAA